MDKKELLKLRIELEAKQQSKLVAIWLSSERAYKAINKTADKAGATEIEYITSMAKDMVNELLKAYE